MSRSSTLKWRESRAPERVSRFDDLWGRILGRFGLGGQLYIFVSTLPPTAMHAAANTSREHIFDAAEIGPGHSLFYLDTVCHSVGTMCLVVVRHGPDAKETLVPCAPLKPETLRNWVLQALLAFRGQAEAYLYVAAPYTGRTYLIRNYPPRNVHRGHEMVLDYYAPVRDLLQTGPTSPAAPAPAWAPPSAAPASPSAAMTVVEPRPRAKQAVGTDASLWWLLAAAVAATLLGLLVYSSMRRQS